MIIFVPVMITFIAFIKADPLHRIEPPRSMEVLNQTRRVLMGHEVGDTRPYMVYLRQSSNSENPNADPNWLCGGVIISERYVLTSASCIEEAKHFYVISGTHRWVTSGSKDNDCINNGAKKAVWKCVPKSFVYDGNDFDNIRWMINDIAIVKVEDDFNFNRRIRGCDFIPSKIAYNNQSADLEKPRTRGFIAGWGSTDHFGDVIARTTKNSPELLETDVLIISKKNCKKRWPERYHYIIDRHMICGKDGTDVNAMSTACSDREVNCKELVYSDEEEEEEKAENEKKTRRFMVDPDSLVVHGASHLDDTRRSKTVPGGFCENDHGGPLIVGQGKTSTVVGVISACQTRDVSHKCVGPFLYTSVWKNRNLISCAIDKDIGPAKSELHAETNMTADATAAQAAATTRSKKIK